MILLDTNVISEVALEHPNAQVIAWLNQHPIETVWITAMTAMELRYGFELMPDGQRKRRLIERMEQLVNEDYEGRVASFDAEAADQAGMIMAQRRQRGLNIEVRDTQIAAIAMVRKATLATRNLRNFADLPIQVINPWTHKA